MRCNVTGWKIIFDFICVFSSGFIHIMNTKRMFKDDGPECAICMANL